MKTIVSIHGATGRRVGVSFNMDNVQQTVFLTQEEFLDLMAQVFDYRDAHKEQLQEVIRNMQR